jgi:uncharacterized cupredoxin-like copper-binding protein
MTRWQILLLGVLLVGLLAGCGPKTAAIQVTMKEYEFSPTSLEVPASAEVTLTLINDGTLEHEMVIMNLGALATAPFDDDDEPNIFWELELAAASSEVVTFTAPGQTGEYQVVCGILEHLENGMIASLTVK